MGDAAYKDMKKAANPPRAEAQTKSPFKADAPEFIPSQPQQLQSPEKQHVFNTAAAEFVPGAAWSPKASLDCGPNAAANGDPPKSPAGVVNITPSPKKHPPSPRSEPQDVGFFNWAGCCAERSKDQR